MAKVRRFRTKTRVTLSEATGLPRPVAPGVAAALFLPDAENVAETVEAAAPSGIESLVQAGDVDSTEFQKDIAELRGRRQIAATDGERPGCASPPKTAAPSYDPSLLVMLAEILNGGPRVEPQERPGPIDMREDADEPWFGP